MWFNISSGNQERSIWAKLFVFVVFVHVLDLDKDETDQTEHNSSLQ